MKVWINGEPAETNGARTIAELAAHYGLHPNAVLIEHNAIALHQREWVERLLTEGDRIEVVRVVAGG
ncbi:MAG TPA: sulfur carrier protein ThiS [Chthoniobacterales bacterium]|nr:sulfur carrier protein ThiS [Chthoniobacterales bacterium]